MLCCNWRVLYLTSTIVTECYNCDNLKIQHVAEIKKVAKFTDICMLEDVKIIARFTTELIGRCKLEKRRRRIETILCLILSLSFTRHMLLLLARIITKDWFINQEHKKMGLKLLHRLFLYFISNLQWRWKGWMGKSLV